MSDRDYELMREERDAAEAAAASLRAELEKAREERDQWKRAAEAASHNFEHDRKRAEVAEEALAAERASNEGLREELGDVQHHCAVIEEERDEWRGHALAWQNRPVIGNASLELRCACGSYTLASTTTAIAPGTCDPKMHTAAGCCVPEPTP